MSADSHTASELRVVAAQMGRTPREPWRVRSRCVWGHPTVITSPSTLEDGTPFPTFAWLTCPLLTEQVSRIESAGGTSKWIRRVEDDPALAEALRSTDRAIRSSRALESGGEDACEAVGIAGQRDPLKVKCLHAHVALALIGIEDPVGSAVLGGLDAACPDERCAASREPDPRGRR